MQLCFQKQALSKKRPPRVQGKSTESARKIIDDAQAMVWDAVAYDDRDRLLLSVNALELRWICS